MAGEAVNGNKTESESENANANAAALAKDSVGTLPTALTAVASPKSVHAHYYVVHAHAR